MHAAPQRLLLPAVDALAKGQDIRPFAFAVAAWMRYCAGVSESGEPYELRDPREDQIADVLKNASTAADISDALHGLDGLFPEALRADHHWREVTEEILSCFQNEGVENALAHEAGLVDE